MLTKYEIEEKDLEKSKKLDETIISSKIIDTEIVHPEYYITNYITTGARMDYDYFISGISF